MDLKRGKSPEYRRSLGDAVYRALVEAVGAPEGDRFQVIAEHGQEGFVYDPGYTGIERTDDDVIFVQITLNDGRTTEQKKAPYARIVGLMAQNPGVRPEDVVINLVEASREAWSWGNGEAQYA